MIIHVDFNFQDTNIGDRDPKCKDICNIMIYP